MKNAVIEVQTSTLKNVTFLGDKYKHLPNVVLFKLEVCEAYEDLNKKEVVFITKLSNELREQLEAANLLHLNFECQVCFEDNTLIKGTLNIREKSHQHDGSDIIVLTNPYKLQ